MTPLSDTKPKPDCPYCFGAGFTNQPNGEDDFYAEPCWCVEEEEEEDDDEII